MLKLDYHQINQTILATAKIKPSESELPMNLNIRTRHPLCADRHLAIKAAALNRHVFAFLYYIVEL